MTDMLVAEALFEAPFVHSVLSEVPGALASRGRRVTSTTVFGFPRRTGTVQSLPQSERQKVEQLAQAIVQSHASGAGPIRDVHLVGHADRDAQAGRRFADRISRERAGQLQRALGAAVMRRNPAVAGRIRWRFGGAGASQPMVRAPRTSADSARNGRVDIFLTASPITRRRGQLSTPQQGNFEVHPPTVSRPCCLLAPAINVPVLGLQDLLAEPGRLGTHGQTSGSDKEALGQISPGRTGFFDLGHVRDVVDMTRYVYEQIRDAGGASGSPIATMHGLAKLTSAVASTNWFQLAMDIAFDDSFVYEIMTYSLNFAGGHNSSFSPEDLPSTYMGTVVGVRAIKASGDFNAAVTAQIDDMLRGLHAQTKVETRKAFDNIKGRWVAFVDADSPKKNDYLRRRNFTLMPWRAGHPSDTDRPVNYGAGMGSTTGRYTYTHTAVRTIAKSDWPTELATIRTDAASRYGPDFDKP